MIRLGLDWCYAIVKAASPDQIEGFGQGLLAFLEKDCWETVWACGCVVCDFVDSFNEILFCEVNVNQFRCVLGVEKISWGHWLTVGSTID